MYRLSLFIALLCATAVDAVELPKELNSHRCSHALQMWIDRLLREPVVVLKAPDKQQSLSCVALDEASSQFVSVSVSDQGVLRFTTEKDHQSSTYQFTDKCEVTTVSTTESIAERDDKSFDDQDLDSLLRDKKNAVLFFWSPTMGLSGLAYERLKDVAAKLGANLIPLMDPWASEKAANEFRSQTAIPVSKKVASKALRLREVLAHYPSLLIVSNGRVSSRRIPGLKTEDSYRELISDELKRLKR